jgi:hypothetical protein
LPGLRRVAWHSWLRRYPGLRSVRPRRGDAGLCWPRGNWAAGRSSVPGLCQERRDDQQDRGGPTEPDSKETGHAEHGELPVSS